MRPSCGNAYACAWCSGSYAKRRGQFSNTTAHGSGNAGRSAQTPTRFPDPDAASRAAFFAEHNRAIPASGKYSVAYVASRATAGDDLNELAGAGANTRSVASRRAMAKARRFGANVVYNLRLIGPTSFLCHGA